MSKAHELIDNFNDNSIDTTKWGAYGYPGPVAERLREVNGRIEIRPSSNDAGHYAGFDSSTYDLTESAVRLNHSPRIASPASSSRTQ
jgi:hypothetical protein